MPFDLSILVTYWIITEAVGQQRAASSLWPNPPVCLRGKHKPLQQPAPAAPHCAASKSLWMHVSQQASTSAQAREPFGPQLWLPGPVNSFRLNHRTHATASKSRNLRFLCGVRGDFEATKPWVITSGATSRWGPECSHLWRAWGAPVVLVEP